MPVNRSKDMQNSDNLPLIVSEVYFFPVFFDFFDLEFGLNRVGDKISQCSLFKGYFF